MVELALPVVLPESISFSVLPDGIYEIIGFIAEDWLCVDRFVTLRPDLKSQEFQVFSSSS
jgi:hypothetical protein